MSEITLEQFYWYRQKKSPSSEITCIPKPYLIFWDINGELSETKPELTEISPNKNPFIFDKWYVSTWTKDDVEYYTIGPIERGKFSPCWLIDKEDFENYWFLVKRI